MIDINLKSNWYLTRNDIISVTALSGSAQLLCQTMSAGAKNRNIFIKLNSRVGGSSGIVVAFNSVTTSLDFFYFENSLSNPILYFAEGGIAGEIWGWTNAGTATIRVTEFEER